MGSGGPRGREVLPWAIGATPSSSSRSSPSFGAGAGRGRAHALPGRGVAHRPRPGRRGTPRPLAHPGPLGRRHPSRGDGGPGVRRPGDHRHRWTGGVVDRSWYTSPRYAPYREPGQRQGPLLAAAGDPLPRRGLVPAGCGRATGVGGPPGGPAASSGRTGRPWCGSTTCRWAPTTACRPPTSTTWAPRSPRAPTGSPFAWTTGWWWTSGGTPTASATTPRATGMASSGGSSCGRPRRSSSTTCRCFPGWLSRSIAVKGRIGNVSGAAGQGSVRLAVGGVGVDETDLPPVDVAVAWDEAGGEFEAEYPLGSTGSAVGRVRSRRSTA